MDVPGWLTLGGNEPGGNEHDGGYRVARQGGAGWSVGPPFGLPGPLPVRHAAEHRGVQDDRPGPCHRGRGRRIPPAPADDVAVSGADPGERLAWALLA